MRDLRDEIIELIRLEGPITVERYMDLCLGHPTLGYYMTRDPFGAAGDFTTAPEISQMFGELLGLWAGQVWRDMGSPCPFRLVEIGPGRGTLIADALRAIGKALPAMMNAGEVHLVETSPVLQGRQRDTLAGAGKGVTWHDHATTALQGPVIVIANELLDALPVQQFVARQGGWHERLVGLDENGALTFGLAAEPNGEDPGAAKPGDVMENPRAAQQLVGVIAEHIVAFGGAALLIDYGASAEGTTDTLQAVSRHRFVDPLADPGNADLTTQVNFRRMATVAALAKACIHGPVPQASFLEALGLSQRAEALKSRRAADQGHAIDAAVARLTAMDQRGMGNLFKVMAISHPSLQNLPGLKLSWKPAET